MATASEDPQVDTRLCPIREKPCAGEACQWWVPDKGDLESGGDCAMIYLALRKDPKWEYGGAKKG